MKVTWKLRRLPPVPSMRWNTSGSALFLGRASVLSNQPVCLYGGAGRLCPPRWNRKLRGQPRRFAGEHGEWVLWVLGDKFGQRETWKIEVFRCLFAAKLGLKHVTNHFHVHLRGYKSRNFRGWCAPSAQPLVRSRTAYRVPSLANMAVEWPWARVPWFSQMQMPIYHLVMTNVANWRINMLLIGKSPI